MAIWEAFFSGEATWKYRDSSGYSGFGLGMSAPSTNRMTISAEPNVSQVVVIDRGMCTFRCRR